MDYTLNIEALQKPIDQSQTVLEEFVSSNRELYHEILIAAITLYIQHHEDPLVENSKLELFESYTEFNISSELLKNLTSPPLTLSKAELLISIFIKSIDICDGTSLNDAVEEETHIFPTEKTSFNIIIFENLDVEKDLIDEFDNITLSSNHPQHSLYELSIITQSLDTESLSFIKMDIVPSSKYETLWRNLKFDNQLKNQLLGHAKISLILKMQNLVINKCNKILLLYGPPGSGKTTLCKAIAQKLAIHQGKSVFIEFQCSKVFSRFFGESSKNLESIFQTFKKLIEANQDLNFIILIDEIETLASSRSNLLKQNETNDGIRVVNTLLTQLDLLKPYDNFLILTTSNNKDSLDDAFLDRCDETFHIQRPNNEAILEILIQSINELIENKIIIHHEKLTSTDHEFSPILSSISQLCFNKETSGRHISRLPIITLAKSFSNRIPVELSFFLSSLAKITAN